LREGDLRTTEDVRDWLKRALDDMTNSRSLWPEADFGPRVRTCDLDMVEIRAVAAVYRGLDERLDRERRQACRRGALEAFTAAAKMMRAYKDAISLGVIHDMIEQVIMEALSDALAFRAAARAK
jgi:hypothetical protein